MTAAEVERQVVVFSLHGEQYALPITSVREIIRYTAPTATAAASGPIQGMISLRGRVLPVVDLSSRLGRPIEVGSRTRILVVELSNGSLGLIVDTVDGVIAIPTAQIEPLPVAVGTNGLGEQIAAVGERLIMLIDAEQALGDVLAPRAAKPPAPAARAVKPPAPTARVAKPPASGAAKPAAPKAKPAPSKVKPAARAAKPPAGRAAKSPAPAPRAAKPPAPAARAAKPPAPRAAKPPAAGAAKPAAPKAKPAPSKAKPAARAAKPAAPKAKPAPRASQPTARPANSRRRKSE